jgi:hypothetical protein
MLESQDKLAEDVGALLEVLLGLGGARYASVLEPGRLAFERPAGGGDGLAELLTRRSAELFALPGRMADEQAPAPDEDLFAGWEEEAFLLAFVNGRVLVALAGCDPDTEEQSLERPLRALVDRLLRFNPVWRGRGFLWGSPRLDLVRIGRAAGEGPAPSGALDTRRERPDEPA